jgi:hypothetical protein
MSFSPTAAVRWRSNVDGHGELGIADGELHFGSGTAIGGGEPHAFSYSTAPFGYGVISDGAVIAVRDNQVWSQRWSFVAPAVPVGELHAATWSTSRGPRQIVTALIEGPTTQLTGLDVNSGAVLFQCEVADLDHVASFEIGATGMVTMSHTTPLNVDICSSCDPRFAQTQNRFQWFSTTTLSTGNASWNGPYGGPTHSHQERHP